MRHTSAAVLELIGYAITWGIVFLTFSNALSQGVEEMIGAVLVAVFLLGLAHVGDACLTYFVARKGLNPIRARSI